MNAVKVPFFRPDLTEDDIQAVAGTLRSGWLTTGPQVGRFEAEFAEAVGAPHAVAVNSCTAALHLAVEALGLRAGELVVVPAMTFAATAEVVRYLGAVPLLVDCDPETLNLDLDDVGRKIEDLRAGRLPASLPRDGHLAGVISVHVGGAMLDVDALKSWALTRKLWVVEDAAHAFPAAWRPGPGTSWQRCGEGTAEVTCFSFYANKTITTGEGGMAVTADSRLAERMRLMSLHGLSRDAWERYSGGRGWDYRITAPGYKYNLTDVAAALGRRQLVRAGEMQRHREEVARRYDRALRNVEELELPPANPDRLLAWHLYPIRLRLERLTVDRNAFLDGLRDAGVGCSVHWRPLHLHPYYEETFGWQPAHLPIASAVWERLVSLPIFPTMTEAEIRHVTGTVRALCTRFARRSGVGTVAVD
jgi:dTDP-4-amino-4,6-dideoxygalactose transaminase